MDNYFIIEINFNGSNKSKTATFKIECGKKFDSFLFYTVSRVTETGEYRKDLINLNKFIFEYRKEKDFETIFEYLKQNGEIL